MKPAVFHPLTEQELVNAAAYYEEQKLGLGLEYWEEVENAVNFLIRYSEAVAIEVRFASVKMVQQAEQERDRAEQNHWQAEAADWPNRDEQRESIRMRRNLN